MQLWKERVYFSFSLYSIKMESQAGTQGRNLEAGLKQNPRRNAAYWIALPGSLHSLPYTPWTTCPQWVGPHHISHYSRTCPPGI